VKPLKSGGGLVGERDLAGPAAVGRPDLGLTGQRAADDELLPREVDGAPAQPRAARRLEGRRRPRVRKIAPSVSDAAARTGLQISSGENTTMSPLLRTR
jgi:hypothetical protein